MKNKKLYLLIILIIAIIVIMMISKNKNKEETNPNEKSGSLIANASIGDFVEYPVEYTNVVEEFNESDAKIMTAKTTGWRVLSIENDTVTLISAGVPLSYYYDGITNDELSNMYTTLNTDSLYNPDGYSYFTKSGFKDGTFDMGKVFNTGLEDFTSLHAMNGYDFETIYNELSGESKSIDDIEYVKDDDLLIAGDNHAFDLIANNFEFYINEVKQNGNSKELYYLSYGMVSSTRYLEHPIRIVVNLKPGIEIAGGTGTASSPLKLK